jgi:AraC-like DNA-binding protein
MTRRVSKVSTKIWCADGLGAAELLRGRFVDFFYDRHTHETASIGLITRGAMRIRLRGTEFEARAGDLYAINADESHNGWPIDAGGWSLRSLHVDIGRLKALVEDVDPGSARQPHIAGPIIRDRALASLFRGVHHGSETAGSLMKLEEQYLEFVARLFERHANGSATPRLPGREDRAIRLAREFLDHRLDKQVRLSDIAQAANLPPYRLFRAFERATGMSPHGYQRQARIRFAVALIRHGRALSEVAAAAGFADQAHLTRSFRRAMGITPGAYRRAFRPTGRPPPIGWGGEKS